jgi:hypothetical protein
MISSLNKNFFFFRKVTEKPPISLKSEHSNIVREQSSIKHLVHASSNRTYQSKRT